MAVVLPHNLISADRPETRRCLILANPKARRVSLLNVVANLTRRDILRRTSSSESPMAFAVLREAAEQAELDACIEPLPPSPGLLAARIRQAEAEGSDTIVAAGGDGTVRAVAQSLVGTRLRLGILPMGTANNVARALGLPSDLPGALRVLAEGCERRVDVGRFGSEYFLEAAGVGLFADVIQACGTEELRPHQLLRMGKVLFPLFWNPRARRLRLTLDGVTEQEAVLMVSVSVGTYLGENMPIAPDAELSDGLFDVVIVGAMSRGELLRFALALRRGQHLELPKVRRVHARSVEIRRLRRGRLLPVHADDHIAGYTPARLEIVPQSLRILTS